MSNTVPNVVIENPRARRIARTVLDVTGIVISVAVIIDRSSDAIDISAVTVPALEVWTYLRIAFGFVVDNPNTPKIGKYGDHSEVSK